GARAQFGIVRPTRRPGIDQVVVAFEEETTGRAALAAAARLLEAIAGGQPIDLAAEIEPLRLGFEQARLGAASRALLELAGERDIPTCLRADGSIQLGWGPHRRRVRFASARPREGVDEPPESTPPVEVEVVAPPANGVLERLFPGGTTGRIPIIAVTG